MKANEWGGTDVTGEHGTARWTTDAEGYRSVFFFDAHMALCWGLENISPACPATIFYSAWAAAQKETD